MFCKNCGAQIEDTATFCKECGVETQMETAQPKQSTGSVSSTFCGNCGSEIKDGAKFCEKCGSSTTDSATVQNVTIVNNQKEGTRYASTAFKFALFGLVFWLCCGLQLLAGLPAILFGALAIKNNEAEKEKAYIAVVIGILDVIIFILLIAAADRA